MQISDLYEASSIGSNDVFAIEHEGTTYKVKEATLENGLLALVVDCGTVASLPKTVNNSAITADMVVFGSALGNPSAQRSDWTVTTAAGSVTISGTISGSTTLKLVLGRSR